VTQIESAIEPPVPRAGTQLLRLLQITDSHLFGDPQGELLGLVTRETFELVLGMALDGEVPVDAIVLTGDLVHDESPEGYQYLARAMAGTGVPWFCIPGNHDRTELMRRYLGAAYVGPIAARRLGPWRLVFLDSTVPGCEGGHLSPERIQRLEALIVADPDPTLVFLHQHPIPIRSLWMDTMGVDNGEELLDCCDRHPQVKAVIYGHVHQEVEAWRGGYPVLGAPSTCLQFLPGSEEFTLDSRAPGFREVLLFPNGRLRTRVVRLDAYPRPLKLDNSGY
jgi:Icc protein